MNPYELIAMCMCIFATLASAWIAWRKERPVHVHFPAKKRLPEGIERELEHARLMVFEKDAQRRRKLRQASKARQRKQGRFA